MSSYLGFAKGLIYDVIETGRSTFIQCDDTREVNRLAVAINRWKQGQIQHDMKESMAAYHDLQKVIIRKDTKNFRLVIEFYDFFSRPVYDLESGEFLGTVADVMQERYGRLGSEGTPAPPEDDIDLEDL